jgi:hypothetical protein
VITEQRFAFARLLEGLSDDEWEQPSLCAGWPHSGRAADSRGLRLHATDTDWSAGAGAELRGPIRMLLLLLTGRTMTALPHLSGPGVQTIIERSAITRAEADQS